MLIDIAYQFLIFLASVLGGIIVGVLFQMYKFIIRGSRNYRKTLSFLDLIFWGIAGVIVYFWLFVLCGAVINLYVILLVILGICIYYFALAKILEGTIEVLVYRFTRIIRVLMKIFLYPLEILVSNLSKRSKKSKKQ